MPISVWQRRDGTQYCRAAPTLRRTPRLVVGVDALGGAYCLGRPGDEHGPDRRLMTCFPYLQGVDVSIEAWNRRWRKLRVFASSCAVPRSHRLRMLDESFFSRLARPERTAADRNPEGLPGRTGIRRMPLPAQEEQKVEPMRGMPDGTQGSVGLHPRVG
jgi:hypothetical protein